MQRVLLHEKHISLVYKRETKVKFEGLSEIDTAQL